MPQQHMGVNMAARRGQMGWRWGANAWRSHFVLTPVLHGFTAAVVGAETWYSEGTFAPVVAPAAPGGQDTVWTMTGQGGALIGYLVRQAGGALRFVAKTASLVNNRLPLQPLTFDRVTNGQFASGAGWSEAVDPLAP